MDVIAERLAGLGDAVRYLAVSDGEGEPESRPNSSSSESDRYEELLVNPTVLTLASSSRSTKHLDALELVTRERLGLAHLAMLRGGRS